MIKTALIDSSYQGFVLIQNILKTSRDIEYVFVSDAKLLTCANKEELLRQMNKWVRFLKEKGVSRIIVADLGVCCTVLDDLSKRFEDIEFIDCCSLLCRRIIERKMKRILFCGDDLTVASCRIKKEVRGADKTILVEQKSLTPLERMQMTLHNPAFIKGYLKSALIRHIGKYDLTVLGCGDYKTYANQFEEILRCEIYLAQDLLSEDLFRRSADCGQYVFTSGDSQSMTLFFKEHLGLDITADTIELG